LRSESHHVCREHLRRRPDGRGDYDGDECAGAAGNAGAEAVYRAAPDGYTLLASFNSTVSISDYLFKGLGYDPLGFEPVSVLTQIPLALVVRADFPAADAKGFVAYAKANPRKLTYASNGVGRPGT
jgi:tripartite-type tricarboxylate transporter receptor subunit TctC